VRIYTHLLQITGAASDDLTVDSVEPDGSDEDPDPLFDSTRDYVEQIDRFKEHQGKRTERKQRERMEKVIVEFEELPYRAVPKR
jgi:hypothetical protein